MPGRSPHFRRIALLLVISLVAAGCGSSDPQASESSETTESPYGTTPLSEATAAWRAAIMEDFEATLIDARCGRSLAEDLKTIDPNYFECGADLKASDGSAFTQDGSVMCKPKCVAHIGEGAGAYDP